MSTLPRRGLNARQAETVGRLLDAAEQELAAVGTERLTIRTVAGRAGVSPATAYTYFGSKNHLFAELFHRKVLLEHPAEITGRTPLQRVTAVTRHLATVRIVSPSGPTVASSCSAASSSRSTVSVWRALSPRRGRVDT